MTIALCLTPDRKFFRQAICTAATILSQPDANQFDVYVVCEEQDVAPNFDLLAPPLRARINLTTFDFSTLDRGVRPDGRFSRAVLRRLFLDRVLPQRYQRIVSVDSDMWIAGPGLGRLAELDLGGMPIAAAYDMIFLMDFSGGALARRFLNHRVALGLGPATPYFNAGLMVIDRVQWSAREFGERAIDALRRAPERYPYLEQSALNQLIAGGFAPLSPRYNFMGDFFLLDLEAAIEPIVLHFVNAPKPWQFGEWRGAARFAEAYRDWFAASPWPEFLGDYARPARARQGKARMTSARRAFADRLAAYLRRCTFVDGWRAPDHSPATDARSDARPCISTRIGREAR
ncbi:MAG: glycosyltransferase [Roseiarcus sp.]|jgi:lipopolysaccharide biosynthesis glycosyltransferase